MNSSSASRARRNLPQGLSRPRLRRSIGKAMTALTRRLKVSISRPKRSRRSSSWTPKTARMITARVIRWVWGRRAKGLADRPALHLRQGDLAHQLPVGLDPLAVEGRQQQLALAHVRLVVEGEDRVRADGRLEDGRVRLAGVHLGGRAGEDLFDQLRGGRRRRGGRSTGSGARRCRRGAAAGRSGSRAGRSRSAAPAAPPASAGRGGGRPRPRRGAVGRSSPAPCPGPYGKNWLGSQSLFPRPRRRPCGRRRAGPGPRRAP